MQVPSSTSHTSILAHFDTIKSNLSRRGYFTACEYPMNVWMISHFCVADFLKLCDTLSARPFEVASGVVLSPA